MKWFKHDADANADAKLQNVLLDYGLEGYGLYWYCIELIAGKVDVGNITFQLEHDARIIARNTGCTTQKVEEMMRYFVKLGLFEDSDGIITCLKMVKRLDKSMTSNPLMRVLIEKAKLEHFGNDDVNSQNHDSVMQDKIRLDKNRIEKNKTRSRKSVDFAPPDGLNLEAWQKWVDFRKASGFKSYKNNAQSAGRQMNNLIKLSGGNMQVQMQIVEQSMNGNWQGLFELRSGFNKPSRNTLAEPCAPMNYIPDGFRG